MLKGARKCYKYIRISIIKTYTWYNNIPIHIMILCQIHHNEVISPIQLSEVDSVKELCKMRDGVLFSDLSKRDIQILIDVICIS